MKKLTKKIVLAIGLAVFAVGCMSVPEGSPAMKQQALNFTPSSGSANVYVIRPYRYTGSAVLFGVSLDYQDFGSLETSSYLFGVVPPGEHTLRNSTPGSGSKVVTFTAESGKNYFFRVTPGWVAMQIDQISEAGGQAYVRKFKLSGDNRFEYQNKTGQTQ